MFFFLSKTLDVLLEPLWWSVALFLAGAGFLARQHRKRTGLGLVLVGLVLLLTCASRPVAQHLLALAEANVENSWRPEVTYDVVVLLGGMVDHAGLGAHLDAQPLAAANDRPAFSEAVERLMVTYDLLRAGRARYAIVSGGSVQVAGPSEARVLTDQLVAWGIEPERVIAEERAMNTRQNATLVGSLMKERGLTTAVVVTSAFHMPRASGAFRAAGLTFDTLPVDFRMRDPSRWADWLPRTQYLAATSQVLHELAGRWVYGLMGYSK